MRIGKFHFILALLAYFPAAPVHAQINDVEVNLDVLGPPLEDYTPPPMFGDAPAESLPAKLPPPIPGRKPYHEKKSAAPVAVKAEKKQIATAAPPVPPRRPGKLTASESFIEEAKKNLDKFAPVKAPVAPVAPRPSASKLGVGELVTPSAKEVLASIDADEAKTIPDAENVTLSNVSDELISLAYKPDAVAVPADIKQRILKQVAGLDNQGDLKRIEIQGFASAPDGNASNARRISLARVLEIRDFLVAEKIDPNRIDLRPMGDQAGKGPQERVDILFVEE